MKILVTGGTGFVGGHIANLLLKKGYEVRIFGRKKPENTELEFFKGDLTDKISLEKALEGIDIICHQAAQGGFSSNFADYVHSNSVGTANMIDIIREKKLPIKQIVFASSQAVYGEGGYKCPIHGEINLSPRPLNQLQNQDWELKCPTCGENLKSLPTKESKPLDGDHIYAVTKKSCEQMLVSSCDELNINLTVFRYSLIYGFGEANFRIFRIFSKKILNREKITLNEDGNQLRDFVYIKDVAAANFFAIERGLKGTFNLSTGQQTSLKDFVNLLSNSYNCQVDLKATGNYRAGDTRHIVLDNNKLKENGFLPEFNLEEGIRDYLEEINKVYPTPQEYFEDEEKEILLIGGSSFIGRNIIEKAPKNWKIKASYCHSEDFLDFASKFDNVEAFHLDLTQENPRLDLGNANLAIYLSTITPGNQGASQENVYDLNAHGVNTVINALKSCGKFIYLSSGIVYLRENDSDYKKSKLLGESNVLGGAMEKGFKYIILRNMEVYGRYMAQHKIYRKLAEKCLQGEEEFEISGDGENLLDTMYIDDYVRGLFKLIKSNLQNEILDFCKSEPISLNNLAKTIARVFNNENFNIKKGGIPTENTTFKLSNERMKEILDFHPLINLEQGMQLWKEEGLK